MLRVKGWAGAAGTLRPGQFLEAWEDMQIRVITLALVVLCAIIVQHSTAEQSDIKPPSIATPLPGGATPRLAPPATAGSPTDRAIATWTEKVKHTTPSADDWVQLGDAFMQKARETADASYYGRAESAFQQALGLNPQQVSALTGMAWVHSVRHEFEQSVVWAKRALEHDSMHPLAHGLLGDAAVEMGEYESAFEHYQHMLDVSPDLASYSRAAHLLYLTGNQRKAVWMMHKAIAAGAPYAENTAWCRAQLALLLWSNGALMPAQQVLETALQETPHNYHVLAAMGKIKEAQGEHHSAIEYYTKAMAIAPQPETLIALGDLYTRLERPEEAAKHYALVEAIHQLNQANGLRDDFHITRLYTDREHKLSEALQAAEALYHSRKNVYTADLLAWCLYKNGRYAEAKSIIKQALSQRTPDAQILFHAGMIYTKLGEQAVAKHYLYRALSLNPNFHPLYATVAADTLKQLGTTEAGMAERTP